MLELQIYFSFFRYLDESRALSNYHYVKACSIKKCNRKNALWRVTCGYFLMVIHLQFIQIFD